MRSASHYGFYSRFTKRPLDILLGALLFLLSLPLLVSLGLVGWVIHRESPLFFQHRQGYNGLPFRVLKLKTMRSLLGPDGKPLPDEVRLTAYGRWLRRFSLDELPQLWNVVMGSMSLIGPRPLPLYYDALYSQVQRRRFEVRPGITGLAQVSGRNALGWYRRLALDAVYARSVSLRQDVFILLETVAVVLRGILRNEGISGGGSETMTPFMGNTGEQFVILAGGGHGQVMAEVLSAQRHTLVGVFDDQPLAATNPLASLYAGAYDAGRHSQALAIVAVGDNAVRKRMAEAMRHSAGIAIHPRAWVAPSAEIGAGTMILAGALVQTQAAIGQHCIVQTGAVVEHHARLGDYVHVYPGSVVLGMAQIGDGCTIWPNAVVHKMVKVGPNCVIDAGAVVRADVPSGTRVTSKGWPLSGD